MEFAKPVIGTREPAPANLPILLKMFNPVKKAEIKINIIETMVLDKVSSMFRYLQYSKIICPMAHIRPPTQKLLKQFFKIGELGDF